MKKNWFRMFMAVTLSVLMILLLVSCGKDEEKTEAPSASSSPSTNVESGTVAPKPSDEAQNENATKGLEYSTGTTVNLIGLGEDFSGTTLRIPSKNNDSVVGCIAAEAFASAAGAAIEEIDIPSSVKKLERGVFDNCLSLKTIRYFGSEELWNIMLETEQVALPDGVEVLFCKYYDLTIRYLYLDGTTERNDVVQAKLNDSNYTVTAQLKDGYRSEIDYPTGVVTEDLTVTVTYIKEIASGACGESMVWSYYEDNSLYISGNGLMYDYIDTAVPWTPYLSQIENIVVSEGVQSIGAYAFVGCASSHILLPESLETVGAYAFSSWTSAQTIEFCGGVNILTKMDAVWNSNLEANICFRYGRYEQDNDPLTTDEPLIWTLVAQDNGAYLLTLMYAIELKPYHNDPIEVTWEDSDLRAWLQNDFANQAFTAEERAPQVTMQKGIGTLNDKLFIFTAAELSSLFPDEVACIRPATAHANPVEIEVENEDGTVETVIGASEAGVYWWLRDSSVLGLNMLAQDVSPLGVTNSDGALVSTADRGVCISVWVKP